MHLHEQDSVVVALRALASGDRIQVGDREIQIVDTIPPGHKVAIEGIGADQPVNKFGWPIGRATHAIQPGQHVHSHNLGCEHEIDVTQFATEIPPAPTPMEGVTFEGYHRPGGGVGTRNYLAVISNVNCSASVAGMIARRFEPQLGQYPNIDGIIALRHSGGCAMAWEGSRHRMLTKVLGGMARHVNIGGYLLVGLGCEQGTLDHIIAAENLHQISMPDGKPAEIPRHASPGLSPNVPVLSIQSAGGTQQTADLGLEVVERLAEQINAFERRTAPASQLTLGLECGGSDGYSGITANPALGAAADLLVACGGTAILSETSEVFGAEQLLTRRARNRAVAEKLVERIEWWKWYAGNYGEVLDNNPSVGNKAGGLTTITEKSLGAVSKGGTTALEAVYEYAEPIDRKGFVLMDTPGFDPASVTGMVAGGANLVAFTTGRGSCFGFKPTPSFKIASNSELFRRLPDDMDFNAGQVVEGKSVAEVGKEIFDQLLQVASGQPTKSELLGLGDEEFVPWQVGPVL